MASSIQLNSTNNSEMKIEYQGTSGVPKTVVVPDRDMTVAGEDYANSLVAEYTVTGSAVTSIDFTGLDINTHKSYRIEAELVNATASNFALACYVNNNTTPTNYHYQQTSSSGVTVSANRNNSSAIFQVSASAVVWGVATIGRIGNGYVYKQSQYNFASSGSVQCINACEISTFTVANVTQLTFVSSVASSIAVGSKIRIYRGNV